MTATFRQGAVYRSFHKGDFKFAGTVHENGKELPLFISTENGEPFVGEEKLLDRDDNEIMFIRSVPRDITEKSILTVVKSSMEVAE